MRLASLLFVAAVACLIVGCVKSDEAPQPKPSNKPPITWDDQGDRDWRFRSQYKMHMRNMWADCNRIVTAGRGDAVPTWHELWSNAADIEQRARLIGGFWRELEQRSAELLECAADDDRIGATEQFRYLGAACDGCHLSTWSQAYLHVTEGILEGWLRNRVTHGQAEEVDPNPPPLIPNRTVMQQLYKDYANTELFLERWMVEDLRQSVTAMQPEFKKRAERWQAVRDNAAEIVELAKKRKREGMKEAYGRMTAACLACHADNAGEGRQILVPMQWDGPLD